LPAVEDPALVKLRDALAVDEHDKALASMAHYRPLCDAQGYPLVGNLQRKSGQPEYQVSELCTEVRAAKK